MTVDSLVGTILRQCSVRQSNSADRLRETACLYSYTQVIRSLPFAERLQASITLSRFDKVDDGRVADDFHQ